MGISLQSGLLCAAQTNSNETAPAWCSSSCSIALGSCAEEAVHHHSHGLPGTDSPVLQVLLILSKLQRASILKIFKGVLDGDY